MSGYGKGQEQYVYDAAATRPNQAPSYSSIAQPSFASTYTDAPARLTHEPSNVEIPYIPSSTYESRGDISYQAESPFIDARSRHPAPLSASKPEVTNAVHPSQGTAGSQIILHIRAKFDLLSEPYTLAFMFHEQRCEATVKMMERGDDYYNYALNVQVPPFPLTNSWNPTMMLKLRLEDKNRNVLSEGDAGNFTFTDMSPTLTYNSSPEVTKNKRKFSSEFGDAQDYSGHATKRANTMRLHAKPRSLSNAYSAASASPLPVQPSLASPFGYATAYSMEKQHSYPTPQLPPKSVYAAVPSGIPVPQTDMKPPQMSPSLPSYSSYGSLAQRSPASIVGTPTRPSVMASPSVNANPVLVRATSLPQSVGGSAGQSFNPYAIYPSKAILKIEGDLDKMSENWTREEFESKRRLVQFERSQSGSTITTTFAPITPEARPARSICVSCILWEEKEECFITSVDTIYLLEQLVNVRFTVEEKNRIRRNLEGFRPLTVSKAKSDSEDFFKIIMGFPNPKPRNIEKDVKVFSWKILAHALKKIISKYTASYSSTAGAGSLPGTSSAAYVPVGIPQSMGDLHRNTSPRSVASSAAPSTYPPSMTSTSVSPNIRTSAGLEGSAAQGMPVPQRDPMSHGMTQWGTAHHQAPQYSAGLSTPGRVSWDYGSYLDASAATGVPSAAQSMQMQRQSDVTPDVDNTYQHYGQRTTRV
ncbi:hypothetical protein K491DRAFT_593566 [Lophiostoma macrostomum CBS 122681]|uniref:DUF7082 domain-containing protein n=1 Tax=Lophiostoma macrostomum CBS 122681 TaxID=1314788 RepID=A0A6A6TEL6_9PLEO|nr:hypothetical protein K491DRAFT_593566 [Lophiostoma macrostomum CBS 122681]